jgi:hypothetical protein
MNSVSIEYSVLLKGISSASATPSDRSPAGWCYPPSELMNLLRASTSAPLLLCALALALAPSRAAADTSADEIAAAFAGHERSAPDGTIRGWGERSIPVLAQLAEDRARPEFVRARAAAALRLFAPSRAARAAMERLATAVDAHPLVLRAALDGLCVEFGDLSLASRFLASSVADHREAAAWSISRSGRLEARAILRGALTTERDPALRATLELTGRELERAIASAGVAAAPRVLPTLPPIVSRPVRPTPPSRPR